ncbi:MAG TPA: FGGY family carbohydrate kinase [Gemmataceae bacterium]|nr:FGGY family carbohydrate kinase [Gemmataceae bacterium]
MRVLGLDLGTTSFKGAVLDLDERTMGPVRRVPTPEPVSALPPGHHELDAPAVLAAVRRLIRELLADAPDADGLFLCSQMHCVVLTDSDGRPRSNVITWKDQRGAGDLFAELQRRVTADEEREIGRELRVGLPVVTLSWLRRHGRLERGLVPASLPDLVLSQLCGVEPTTEATNAAAHGLFHLERGDWHHELIAKLGLSDLRWPRVRPFGEVVGTPEIAGHRLRCFTPVGDQQCALAGVELGERELSLNISTGSQVSLLAREPGGEDYQVRPYFDGRWLRTIVQVPAGRSLSVLVNLLSEIPGGRTDPWEYIARESERAGETDLDVNLAFFAGPFGASGSVASIREGNLTVGNLFAAAFRSMAENYARCAERLSPDQAWERVVFSGGLARRFERLRRGVLSRLGDRPWRLCPTEEDTLQGLLILAGRWLAATR